MADFAPMGALSASYHRSKCCGANMVKCSSPLTLPPKAHCKGKGYPVGRYLDDASSTRREVRCGRCGNCLQFERQCWKGRLLLEWLYRGQIGQMVTFTYRDGDLPEPFLRYRDWQRSGSPGRCPVTLKERLGVRDIRRWIKNFKQACRDRGLPVPKVFYLSEHGEKKDRPHHHVIILGLPLSFERVLHAPSGVMESQLIGFPWEPGFINFKSMSDIEDAERRARYLTNYVTTKAKDVSVRGFRDGIGKEPIKAFFLANLMETYPEGPPAFVFSRSALDLRSAGLGIYPMQQTLQDWCKEEAERIGVAYLSPRIDDPYQQPEGLMMWQPELVKEYSQSEHAALHSYRRQCAAVRATASAKRRQL